MEFNADAVRKYLRGKFSLKDKALVDEYFQNEQYSSELNEVLKQHWEECGTRRQENKKDLNPVLDKINHLILLHHTTRTDKLKILWQYYSRIAAVLLLPVILFAVLDHIYAKREQTGSSWVEVYSPYGARTRFSLPDGTSGWLNSGSVIRYPVQFGSERTVSLNGEAYFDVVKDLDSPFIIHANPLNIKVLGTSLNVVSYDHDSISELIVASGKVEVAVEGKKFRQEVLPSERLVMNRLKNKLTKSRVDVQNYTSWRTGDLIFLNDNLNEVVRKVSRFYNVDFEVKDHVNREQLFRAILEKESLEEVLRYMKLTMDIDYTILERKANQNNRLSRRKVILTGAINN